MKVKIIWIMFVVWAVTAGCKTDKMPTSSMENTDPNGEEELLKVFKASEDPGVVKVMSQNVYIGTNVTDILDAPTIETVPVLVASGFQEVQNCDFLSRAEAIAVEIEKTMPHLIGLQEMTVFYRQSPGDLLAGGTIPATDVFLDYFEELMNALQARGLNYQVVDSIANADIELPMFVRFDGNTPVFDDIRIVDHDAILARDDVVISNPVAVRYDSMLVVNFDENNSVSIPRGYVAVTAKIGGTSVVFTNTHLESMGGRNLREAEVRQLLDDYKNESLPVIMVGDFNSRALTGNAYNLVLNEGFTDTWLMNPLTYNPNGYTYGHSSDLRNETPHLSSRIDYVFAGPQGNPTIGNGFVLGDETRDKTSNGLWPSDHAGVVTKLTYSSVPKLVSK